MEIRMHKTCINDKGRELEPEAHPAAHTEIKVWARSVSSSFFDSVPFTYSGRYFKSFAIIYYILPPDLNKIKFRRYLRWDMVAFNYPLSTTAILPARSKSKPRVISPAVYFNM